MPDDPAPAFFCAQNSHGVNTPAGNTPLQTAEAAASAAPLLFCEADLGFEKLEATGEFTGERLLSRRPETYRAVVRMAAEGLSISATARALGVSRNTVAAVREREGFTIEQSKKELLATIRRGSQIAAERVVELVPHIQSAKDAAITLAVLVDKAALLAGEATSRIERIDTAGEDKLREMLASLPVLEAELVPATGPCAPAPGQKGPAASAALAAPNPVVDNESTVSTNTDSAAPATLSATLQRPAEFEPLETAPGSKDSRGGEGGAILAAPPTQPTHQGPQKIFDKGNPSTPPAAAP